MFNLKTCTHPGLFFCLNLLMVLLLDKKLNHVYLAFWHHFSLSRFLLCSVYLTTVVSCPIASECSTAFSGAGLLPPLSPPLPPPCRAAPRVCPPVRARAREVAGGCARSCSLCSLTPVAAPTHCTPAPPPSHRVRSLSLPLSPLSVSVSRPPLRVSPPRSLVWFLSTGASRGPAGSKVLP